MEIKSQIMIFEKYISSIANATSVTLGKEYSIALITDSFNIKKVLIEYFTDRIAELEKEFEEL